MKKIIFLLPLILFFASAGIKKMQDVEPEGRIRTVFTGKIEYWEARIGKDEGAFEGYMMNDVNRWTFEISAMKGEVNTEFNDTYNSWIITVGDKTYNLKSWLSNSWNRWEISGSDLKTDTVTIQTVLPKSWNNWQLKRDSLEVDFSTYYGKSWDDWHIDGDLSKLTDGEKIATLFLPIFVSRIYNRRLVH
ncbi:MAG: hypothetical protein ABIQ40_12540 [Bacteroidia bacterium]